MLMYSVFVELRIMNQLETEQSMKLMKPLLKSICRAFAINHRHVILMVKTAGHCIICHVYC